MLIFTVSAFTNENILSTQVLCVTYNISDLCVLEKGGLREKQRKRKRAKEIVREREQISERERERDRQTDRQTDRQKGLRKGESE